MIPLASLACILFVVGYNLAKPSLFKAMYELGWSQFAPFIATVIGILLTDLLKGIGIGMVVAIFFILRSNLKTDYELFYEENDGGKRSGWYWQRMFHSLTRVVSVKHSRSSNQIHGSLLMAANPNISIMILSRSSGISLSMLIYVISMLKLSVFLLWKPKASISALWKPDTGDQILLL